MNLLPYTCLGAALLSVLSPSYSLAVGVTLTFGSTNSVNRLELKPGEKAEFAAGLSMGKDPGNILPYASGRLLLEIRKDGLEWPISLGMGANGVMNQSEKIIIVGPAVITASSLGPYDNNGTSIGGYATFEVTPAPAALEKLVVVPEGQGARLVLEASTNLNSWAPIFSTVLTNVPANQFIRVRSEKAP